jgi:hypothetical protein
MTVLYYQNGVRTTPPRPAVVMQATPDNSILALNVFPEQGGTLAFRRCVYHLHDPHLVKNPNVGMSYGAWTHLDAGVPHSSAPSATVPPALAEGAAVPAEPTPAQAPPSGNPQADLMNKLLQTAGK